MRNDAPLKYEIVNFKVNIMHHDALIYRWKFYFLCNTNHTNYWKNV